MPLKAITRLTLQTLRRTLPEAAKALNLDLGANFQHWIQTVDGKLLPRLDDDYPFTVAICGGGSAGKSTLFNSLVGQPLSPVGGKAGLNRRVLMAANDVRMASSGYLQHLGHVFGGPLEPLAHPDQLLIPGVPLYHTANQLPAKVLLLDTPDIDTGARHVYTNRDMARRALEVADLFIYIFTNATYHNRANTDFIAEMLTGMGTRPCLLVYRVYTGFSDEEVRAHARTVAENIYGIHANQHVLGLYRSNEDNAVAAGSADPTLTPVMGVHKPIATVLAGLDLPLLRTQLMKTMTDDAMEQARQTVQSIRKAVDNVTLYTEALVAAQGAAVQQVLSHFPTDQVLRQFARIWMTTDPSHIKWMRTTGRIIGWPVKAVSHAMRHLTSQNHVFPSVRKEKDLGPQIEKDLLNAANQLYQKCMDAQVMAADGKPVPVPATLLPVQKYVSQQPWQKALEALLSKKEEILSWSRQLDDDLKALANDLRSRMGLLDQIRQTFAALLNVIPATAAITYVLHTGDPVGATGIKIKLTGLLGLHDLYALVAIPATAGISRADQRQLTMLLRPLARTWLANKYLVVQQRFEEHITGELLQAARRTTQQVAVLLEESERVLNPVSDPTTSPLSADFVPGKGKMG